MTHFEKITGDDIVDDDDRVDKIQLSLNQALENVSKQLNDSGKSHFYLKKQLDEKSILSRKNQ